MTTSSAATSTILRIGFLLRRANASRKGNRGRWLPSAFRARGRKAIGNWRPRIALLSAEKGGVAFAEGGVEEGEAGGAQAGVAAALVAAARGGRRRRAGGRDGRRRDAEARREPAQHLRLVGGIVVHADVDGIERRACERAPDEVLERAGGVVAVDPIGVARRA